MPTVISVPLQVFGYGFVISIFIAILIKVLMFLITRTSREKTDDTEQG